MKYLVLCLSFVLTITACKKDKEECAATAGTTVAPAAEEQVVTKYLQDSSIANTVELDNSGLYYKITQQGSSERPGLCSAITVKYKGKLASGYVFDQTTDNNTARFTLGGVIEGWKRSLLLVGEGAKISLYIPASLGYGATGQVNPRTGAILIPPNSMLIFDVEIISID